MKKLKFFALAAMLILVAALPAVATTPSDISGHWGAQYINQAVSSGIVKGYPDGTFKPENSITRAEFVTMLARCPESNSTVVDGVNDVQGFSDAKGHWAAPYLTGAVKDSVLNGFEDGSLRPDDTITREQVAAILGRKTPDAPKADELLYADGSHISNWALDGVGILYQAGIMRGDERGFRPQDKLTRAEAAKVLVEWRKWRQSGSVSGQANPYVPAGWKLATYEGNQAYVPPDAEHRYSTLYVLGDNVTITVESRGVTIFYPCKEFASAKSDQKAKELLLANIGDPDLVQQIWDYGAQKTTLGYTLPWKILPGIGGYKEIWIRNAGTDIGVQLVTSP